MGKSRPRHKNKHRGIVIHKERPWIIKIVELLVTLILWIYLLSTLALAVSIVFNLDFEWKRTLLFIFQAKETDVQYVMYQIGVFGVFFFALQFIWMQSNYRRFGKLKRRSFPQEVQPQELAEYFSFTEEEIDYLQKSDIIKLKDRII